MPYITEDARVRLGFTKMPTTPGELNYTITKIVIREPSDMRREIKAEILKYIADRASYTLFNEIMGVLECARLEYIRRAGYDGFVDGSFYTLKKWFYSDIVAPYEDKKIQENGDVFPEKA